MLAAAVSFLGMGVVITNICLIRAIIRIDALELELAHLKQTTESK